MQVDPQFLRLTILVLSYESGSTIEGKKCQSRRKGSGRRRGIEGGSAATVVSRVWHLSSRDCGICLLRCDCDLQSIPLNLSSKVSFLLDLGSLFFFSASCAYNSRLSRLIIMLQLRWQSALMPSPGARPVAGKAVLTGAIGLTGLLFMSVHVCEHVSRNAGLSSPESESYIFCS